MDIQIIKEENNFLSFIIKDVTSSYINTLRRIMNVEVPIMAIDEINFIVNDSALYDEIIAHRLGLIPLKTDLQSYELKEKCTCNGVGCAKCQLTLTLKTKGPCTVYASDLKSQDPKVIPVYPKIPITKLSEGQSIELEATAKLGLGKEHVKFSPGLIYYQAYPEIKLKDVSNPEKIKEVCPTHVFEVENNKLTVKNLLNCDLCMACVEATQDDSIQVKGSKTDYIFYIESFGQLTPKEIMTTAINVFDDKLDELTKKMKEGEESKISKITDKIKIKKKVKAE
ncbi:DNA-directed RNA polymerase subunit D [Candidatus Woesearchaeota archaeon]|nr:DNA-directed RNA polymerase subunit D [Candidatus Woesearchaeota archaeon]